ncbi:MAG TPA: hypothetical protein VIV60_28140, partial [Polyangiaceae bacterium]
MRQVTRATPALAVATRPVPLELHATYRSRPAATQPPTEPLGPFIPSRIAKDHEHSERALANPRLAHEAAEQPKISQFLEPTSDRAHKVAFGAKKSSPPSADRRAPGVARQRAGIGTSNSALIEVTSKP